MLHFRTEFVGCYGIALELYLIGTTSTFPWSQTISLGPRRSMDHGLVLLVAQGYAFTLRRCDV